MLEDWRQLAVPQLSLERNLYLVLHLGTAI
jgi:hypothetical protein